MTNRKPDLSAVIAVALRDGLANVHTSMPAQVITYDSVSQTASLRLCGKHRQPIEDNGTESLSFPILDHVPVGGIRFGPWFMHGPLTPGDFVTVHFAEHSLDRWRESGGADIDPVFEHRFELCNAYAVPINLYPTAEALTNLSSTDFVIGLQGGVQVRLRPDGTIYLGTEAGAPLPLDAVASAARVLAQLQALAPALSALAVDLAAISLAVGAGATSAALLGPLATSLAALTSASVASPKVLIDP